MNKRGWAVTFAGLGVNLALGVLYSWGVFASELRVQGWSATQSQIPYMVACAVFAALMVPGGKIQDRLGPKLVLMLAAILTGVGFIFSGFFMTVIGLSLFFGIVFGMAMGFGYSTTTPAAIKWFGPHKRGLISGIVVSGFGLAGIYVAPLTTYLIETVGLQSAFIILVIFYSIVIILMRLVIKNPPEGYVPAEPIKTEDIALSRKNIKDFSFSEMIYTPQFFSLWIMFFAGTFAGLMVIGKLSNIAQEQVGLNSTQATTFIVIYAVFNWLGRIMFGMISDKIGRKITAFSIFAIQFACFAFFSQFTTYFLLAMGTALVAFCFGGMLANFPAATADYFGLKNLGMNYGVVFTAWGVGGILGPLMGGLVRDITGTYNVSYIVAAALCVLGSILSIFTKSAREFQETKKSSEALTMAKEERII